MCIRDSFLPQDLPDLNVADISHPYRGSAMKGSCLLYTSDAADDLTRVDLVCRRFFQAEDGIRYLVRSRGLGDVYKRQFLTSGFARFKCGRYFPSISRISHEGF